MHEYELVNITVTIAYCTVGKITVFVGVSMDECRFH